MLEKVLAEKYKQIDEGSARAKKGVLYLVELVEQDTEKFILSFNPDGKISEEKLPEHIYDSVEELIKDLSHKATSLFGVSMFHFVPGQEPRHPAVILGWGEYICMAKRGNTDIDSNNKLTYVLGLTKLGMQIINHYRNALDMRSVEECQRINAKERAKWPLSPLY